MENYIWEHDTKVICVKADSFPAGIAPAFQQLHTSVGATAVPRQYLGLSRPENGIITYYAATVEATPGEAESVGLPVIILKSGNYLSISIPDFMKEIESIGKAFTLLTSQPGLDPEGYCIERYTNDKDVHCMVRLA